MKRTLVRTLAASVAALPGAAFALGLGPIQVNSAFDQPLDAKIPIIAVRPGEIDQLSASIPGRALFERMGMEPTPVLNQLTFTVEGLDGRQPYIQVRSRGSVREPLLDILVEVSWASGRILRDYSIFLDPPNVARRARAARQSRTAQAPQRSTAPATTPNVPVTPRFSGDRYLVGQGETLYSIANQTRPDGSVSTNRMMIALFEANPDAFFAPNIDSLNAGADLRVPSRDEVAAISESQALAAIREQSVATASTEPAGGSSVAVAEATGDTTESSAGESGLDASAPEAVAEAASEPMLRLVQSAEGSAEVPGIEGSGSGNGQAASQTEGASAFTLGSGEALIRLEDDGMGLRLVGMEGLSSRLPALIALQDSSLVVGEVGPVTEDSAVQPMADMAVGSADAVEGADAVENAESSANMTPAPTEADALTEPFVAAETSETGPESMVDMAAEALDGNSDSGPLDFEEIAEDVPQGVTATASASEQTPELTTPADAPLLAEGSDATIVAEEAGSLAEALSQDGSTVTEPEAESTAAEKQAAAQVPPKQGFDLWLDRGRNMIADAKAQFRGLGSTSEPRTLAMVGGGLLLLLLLTLLMVRRLFKSAGTPPTAATKRATAGAATAVSVPQSMDPMDQAAHLIENGEPSRAVSLLRGLMARDSDDARVALTLMSAHLAAGDVNGFTHDAETHRSVLELGGVWEEVEDMAQDLCPDHPLFAAPESLLDEEEHPDAAADSEPDTDGMFALGDDHESVQEAEKYSADTHSDQDEKPAETQVDEPVSAPTKQADILEFTPAPRLEPAAETELEQDSPSAIEDGLEFDFDEYRTSSDSDFTEDDLVNAESASELEDVGVALEEEFAKLEAEGLTDILEPELGETDSLLPSLEGDGEDVIGFDAGLDEGLDDEDQSFIETKLDLATAYLEMGDDTGARSLYQEVLEEGNDDQKRLAMTGLQKLG